tara:strand:- start:68 stop:232 length:165 start_codon:yes stop_codon:yes gene_type:complete
MNSKNKPLHKYHDDLIKEIDDAAWLDKVPTVDDIEEDYSYIKELTYRTLVRDKP